MDGLGKRLIVTPVVASGHGPESFLPSSVPDLELDHLVVDLHGIVRLPARVVVRRRREREERGGIDTSQTRVPNSTPIVCG